MGRGSALDDLAGLQASGIVGAAFNVPFHGADYYRDAGPLLAKLAGLGLFLQVQTEGDQILPLLELIERSPVHRPLRPARAGRGPARAGLQGRAGFKAVLALRRAGRAYVKLSGYSRFSRQAHPFADTRPFVAALVDVFTLDRCP